LSFTGWISPVPEPTTILFFGIGLIGLSEGVPEKSKNKLIAISHPTGRAINYPCL